MPHNWWAITINQYNTMSNIRKSRAKAVLWIRIQHFKWIRIRTSMLQKKSSALKRKHPVFQKIKFDNCFLFLRVIFALWIRIRTANPDPDTGSRDTKTKSGSGSTTLLFRYGVYGNSVCFLIPNVPYTIRKCLKFREINLRIWTNNEFCGIPRNSITFGGTEYRKSFTLREIFNCLIFLINSSLIRRNYKNQDTGKRLIQNSWDANKSRDSRQQQYCQQQKGTAMMQGMEGMWECKECGNAWKRR